MFTIESCLVVGVALGLRLRSDLVSGWLSGYAHVFVLLSVVIEWVPVEKLIIKPRRHAGGILSVNDERLKVRKYDKSSYAKVIRRQCISVGL